jgi:cytoskeletal protein CcmA (bactofilin family)
MPSPNEEREQTSITLLTIVGSHARMEGKFDIAESIQIECEVGGELNVGGRLVIGRHGVVHADVRTVDAVIMGHYEGNMVATGDVEIAETGRVTGNIQTDSLVISKGGFFNGNVTKMKEAPALQVVSAEERRTPAVQHSWMTQPPAESPFAAEDRRAFTPKRTYEPPKSEDLEIESSVSENRGGNGHRSRDKNREERAASGPERVD